MRPRLRTLTASVEGYGVNESSALSLALLHPSMIRLNKTSRDKVTNCLDHRSRFTRGLHTLSTDDAGGAARTAIEGGRVHIGMALNGPLHYGGALAATGSH